MLGRGLVFFPSQEFEKLNNTFAELRFKAGMSERKEEWFEAGIQAQEEDW